MWFVYLIKSKKKDWYYVGSTNSLQRRLMEHNSGKSISTKGYKPFEIVYTKKFLTENEARGFERKIKANRIIKENIIKNL